VSAASEESEKGSLVVISVAGSTIISNMMDTVSMETDLLALDGHEAAPSDGVVRKST
jgi:hypothetical protein